jgi:hypothetical protein
MIVAFWIVAGLTALVFLAAGTLKLIRPRETLAASGLAWTEDFTDRQVKLIGLAELLGGIGLVLPVLLNILPILSPIAAIALAALMTGATATHVRRKEPPVTLALVALSVASAVLGFIVVLG